MIADNWSPIVIVTGGHRIPGAPNELGVSRTSAVRPVDAGRLEGGGTLTEALSDGGGRRRGLVGQRHVVQGGGVQRRLLAHAVPGRSSVDRRRTGHVYLWHGPPGVKYCDCITRWDDNRACSHSLKLVKARIHAAVSHTNEWDGIWDKQLDHVAYSDIAGIAGRLGRLVLNVNSGGRIFIRWCFPCATSVLVKLNPRLLFRLW